MFYLGKWSSDWGNQHNLGIIDVLCISISTILYGIFTFFGTVYCDYPRVFYTVGAVGLGKYFIK